MHAQEISAVYFDGKTSKAHSATIYPVYHQHKFDGFIVSWQGGQKRYLARDYDYLPAVVGSMVALEMADGARLELQSLPDWLPAKRAPIFERISMLEKSWRWALSGVAVVALLAFVVVRYGVPMAAHHVAFSLPASVLDEIGDEAVSQMTQMTTPSQLSPARIGEIQKLYQSLPSNSGATIIIRHGGELEANAFAVPNNTIIITDELINLATDDRQILAVLAHEQGHLSKRHSLQQLLSLTGMGILTVVVTGDASELLSGLPMLMAGLDYSRQFEKQADEFAINELTAMGVSPVHLADFFRQMKKHDDTGGGHWTILSTHPDTDARITNAQKAAQK